MSIYWSRLASRLSPYIPGEQPKDKKFIKLNTNENPYPPSPKALEAIQKAANADLRLYPDPACTLLREAAAKRWDIKTEQVFCGNGSDEILAFAFAAFFDSAPDGKMLDSNATGSKMSVGNAPVDHKPILFPDITYSFYPVYAALWDIPYKTPSLNKDFSINPDDYKHNCGGVIIPNPNAPTGRALSIDALREIADAQEKNKKVLVVDEAYIAFANGSGTGAGTGSIGTLIPYINDHPNLLVIRTLSKDAAFAGLRAGYAAGSKELIEGLIRVKDSFNSYTMGSMALAASAAAVLDVPYYDDINQRICQTRDRVTKELVKLGFDVVPSQANFLFACPPEKAHNNTAMTAAMLFGILREQGILVRHFNKPKIDKYLRISIGTDEEMDVFLSVCKKAITGD